MSTAAIVAARQAKGAQKRPAGGTQKVTAERLRAKKEELQRRQEIQELFIKYDEDQTGKLSEKDIKKMLTDLDSSTPPGTAPTDDEVKFIMSVADWDDSGKIEKNEVSYVISAWTILTSKRSELANVLKEFDKAGDGKLNKEELTAYLTKLNGGEAVTPEEVDWVWAQADVLGDGSIHGPEIVMASAAWFAHVEEIDVVKGMPEANNAVRGGILVAEENKIRQTFRKWDCSGTGIITKADLTALLAKTGVTDRQIEVLFKDMDGNKDDQVSYEEFINYIFSSKNSAEAVAGAVSG